MKKSILLFTATAALGFFTLTSYQDGPAQNGQGNRTGSGSNATCGGGGCHGANNTGTTITMVLTDQITGQNVTTYTPGKAYFVNLGGSNPSASKFGFQATCVKTSNTSVDAGLLSQGTSATQVVPVSPLHVIEHSSPLGNTGTFNIQFDWVAPVAGTGSVTFFTIVNAVNGNNQPDASDHATTKSFTFTEHTASVASLSQNIHITAYPNPATDLLNLKFEDVENGVYNIAVIDIAGKVLHSQDVSLTGNANVSIESSSWAPGIYFTRIMKDGAMRMIPVSKK